MSTWYVMNERGEQGPFTSDELRRQFNRGLIQPDDSVRPAGEDAWLLARHCQALLVDSRGSLFQHRYIQRGLVAVAGGTALVAVLLLGYVLGSSGRASVASQTEFDNSPAAAQEATGEPRITHRQPVVDDQAPAEPDVNLLPLDQPPAKPDAEVPAPQLAPEVVEEIPAAAAVVPEALVEGSDARPAIDPLPGPGVGGIDAAIPRVPDREAKPQPVPQPQAPVAPQRPTLTAQAAPGKPFGVAELEIKFAANNRPRINPDEPIFVVAEDRRVFYPAIDIDYANHSEHTVSAIKARFLFQGDADLRLSLAVAGKQLDDSVAAAPGEQQRQRLTSNWWNAYCRQINQVTPEHRVTLFHLAESLGRRMNLGKPPEVSQRSAGPSEVEKYFETATGMLLGFDSVELALQSETEAGVINRHERVSFKMPGPVRLNSVTVPDTAGMQISIESIATRVPEECYYIRCRSLENYLWLRQVMLDWGGSLKQVVATSTTKDLVRDRLEKQLAVSPQQALEAGLDRHIRDFAIIGSDTLFQTGATVGVLLETDGTDHAEQILAAQRDAIKDAVKQQGKAIEEDSSLLNGRTLHRLITPDNRVRSFLIRDGSFLFVTNSLALVKRFVECGRSGGLGATQEFRFARLKMQADADEATFIYLSDPFFRNVVSPRHRIEMRRRAHAMADLEQARIAYATALSEGSPARTVDELINVGYLPADFKSRPDESHAVLDRGYATDSFRGAAGTFLPVADVNSDRITRSEATAYGKFTQGYRKQWRLMDPVSVSVSRTKLNEVREKVTLDICITPTPANIMSAWLAISPQATTA